jgi:hypothetical protein
VRQHDAAQRAAGSAAIQQKRELVGFALFHRCIGAGIVHCLE